MSADRRIDAYLTLADEEIHAAGMLAGGAPRQAAYYIQQAAEKGARALLTAAGIPFGTGHNLGLSWRPRSVAGLPVSGWSREGVAAKMGADASAFRRMR